MDKQLFFLILSISCIWLIVDQAIGKHYINNFLASLFPFIAKQDTASKPKAPTKEQIKSKFGGDPMYPFYDTGTKPIGSAAQKQLDKLTKDIKAYEQTGG